MDAAWENHYFHSASDGPVAISMLSTLPTFICTETLKEMSGEIDAFMKALSQTTTSTSQLIDPMHPHIFLTDGTQITRGVQTIVQQFNLNDDQAFAFQINVDHIIGRSKVGS